MLTQEEVRIKAGLDYSKVTAGLTDIRGQIFKLASDVPKALGNVLKANVFGFASDSFSLLAAKATDMWLSIYANSDAVKKARLSALQDLQDFSKKTLSEITSAKEEYDKALRKFTEGGMSKDEKLSSLRKESDNIRNQIRLKEKEAENIKMAREGYTPENYGKNFSYDERNRLALEVVKTESEILRLKARQLEIDDASAKLNRESLKEIGNKFWSNQAAIQESRSAAIGNMSNLAGALGDAGFGLLASAISAQAEMMKNTPQPVRIVSVD